MDKNTVIGLLLMAAVFFGFMWLSPRQTPSEDSGTEEATEMSAQVANTIDSLTSVEW